MDQTSVIQQTLLDRSVKFCDVTSDKIFANDDVDDFDVLITSLVFDVVALNVEDFRKYLANVVNLLKPGENLIKTFSSLLILL